MASVIDRTSATSAETDASFGRRAARAFFGLDDEAQTLGWRAEPPTRYWRIYRTLLALLSAPYFVTGFLALAAPPVSTPFLIALLIAILLGNVCVLRISPFRFLHQATGLVLLSGFLVAGPVILALLALSLIGMHLVWWALRELDVVGPVRPIGLLPSEILVPAAAIAIAIGVANSLHSALGMTYPIVLEDLSSQLRLLLVGSSAYVTFIVLNELGVGFRFGFARSFGTPRARSDLLLYVFLFLMGLPLLPHVVRQYGPAPNQQLRAYFFVLWGFGTFVVAEVLVQRRLQIERLSSAVRRQERLAALGRIASVIAHQTRHHLGILNMSAYVLSETLAREKLSDTARVRVLHELEAIARTQIELDRLLARELRGHDASEVFDLLELAHECGSDLHDLKIRKLTEIRYFGDGVSVRGDRLRLKQALVNLMRNAIEAAPPETVIDLTIAANSGWATLCVRDRGPGLSGAAREHVFEPLFTDKPDGLGMGLYVARAVVEAHGGMLELSSSDPGTSATLRVPEATATIASV